MFWICLTAVCLGLILKSPENLSDKMIKYLGWGIAIGLFMAYTEFFGK